MREILRAAMQRRREQGVAHAVRKPVTKRARDESQRRLSKCELPAEVDAARWQKRGVGAPRSCGVVRRVSPSPECLPGMEMKGEEEVTPALFGLRVEERQDCVGGREQPFEGGRR